MTSKVEKLNWKQELTKFLRNYRATPHCSTKKAPASLMFANRIFSTRIPERTIPVNDDQLHESDRQSKEKMKRHAETRAKFKYINLKVGDNVLVKQKRRNKSDTFYDPDPYVVIRMKGNMVTANRNDHEITRNISFFKRINSYVLERHEESDDDDVGPVMGTPVVNTEGPEEPENDETVLRRSTRVTAQPVRYPMDVAV